MAEVLKDPIDRLPKRIAEVIRKHQSSTYVKLGPIFQELGISVKRREMAANESGEAYYFEGASLTGFEVALNSKHSAERRRFTAAHELGHCLLHGEFLKQQQKKDPLFTTLNRGNDAEFNDLLGEHVVNPFDDPFERLREREADEFAVAVLMPNRVLNKNWRGGFKTTSELAKRMGVSVPAMKRRLIKRLY